MAAVPLCTAAQASAIAMACKDLLEGRFAPDHFILNRARASCDVMQPLCWRWRPRPVRKSLGLVGWAVMHACVLGRPLPRLPSRPAWRQLAGLLRCRLRVFPGLPATPASYELWLGMLRRRQCSTTPLRRPIERRCRVKACQFRAAAEDANSCDIQSSSIHFPGNIGS